MGPAFSPTHWSARRACGRWTGGGSIGGPLTGAGQGVAGSEEEWWRPPKKRNGRTAYAVTAVPRVNYLRSWLSPPFFSSPPPFGCCTSREGGVRPQFLFPGRMAIPPGSFTPALRLGSGRGPTLRTALRGATSERVEHATGSTCPGRVITRIISVEGERAPLTPPLPNRPNCRRLQAAPERSRYECNAPLRYGAAEIAQVPDFLRFTPLGAAQMWRAKSCSLSHQQRSDTHCGNVNPHGHIPNSGPGD